MQTFIYSNSKQILAVSDCCVSYSSPHAAILQQPYFTGSPATFKTGSRHGDHRGSTGLRPRPPSFLIIHSLFIRSHWFSYRSYAEDTFPPENYFTLLQHFSLSLRHKSKILKQSENLTFQGNYSPQQISPIGSLFLTPIFLQMTSVSG